MSDPAKMEVTVGDFSETDLMTALNEVVKQFKQQGLDKDAITDAVNWLQSRYSRE